MLRSKEEVSLNALLNAVAERQEILSNNLTNVRTKGYERKDLDFSSVLSSIKNAENAGMEVDMNKAVDNAKYQDFLKQPTYESELSEMATNHLKYVMLTRINGHIYQHLEEATQSGRAA